MSRSRKKTPIHGNTTRESEKKDKQMANRRYRRNARHRLRNGQEVLPLIREMSDVWDFDKDGKRWYRQGRYPELMRK